MKLYERFGDRGFHTCLMTTFGVDFDAFESIVLPRLRGASCFNNALVTDSGMLAYVLNDPACLPTHAGRHYTVTGVRANGVFHPKLALQLGRASGRLIVASANMTAPGLAGNPELAGFIEAGLEQAGERQLLATAWDFLQHAFTTGEQGLAHSARLDAPADRLAVRCRARGGRCRPGRRHGGGIPLCSGFQANHRQRK